MEGCIMCKFSSVLTEPWKFRINETHSCCFWKLYLLQPLNALKRGMWKTSYPNLQLHLLIWKIFVLDSFMKFLIHLAPEFPVSGEEIRRSSVWVGFCFFWQNFELDFLAVSLGSQYLDGTFIFIQERETAGKIREWMNVDPR